MKLRGGVISILLLFVVSACAQSVALKGSPAIPAAKGEAKVSKDNNNNTLVEIEVQFLAPPQNLTPAKSVYVVWAQVPQGRTVNLGQMNVGENRVAKFFGVTPFSRFRILVTAEDLPAAANPSKQEILATEVFTVN